MTQAALFFLWLSIILCMAAVAFASFSLAKQDLCGSIMSLMEAHAANMTSGDAERARASHAKWQEICNYMKRSRGGYEYGVILERFGNEMKEKAGI